MNFGRILFWSFLLESYMSEVVTENKIRKKRLFVRPLEILGKKTLHIIPIIFPPTWRGRPPERDFLSAEGLLCIIYPISGDPLTPPCFRPGRKQGGGG